MQNPAGDLQELLRQQESLREVIASISSELELRPLLTRIVRHACELLGADRGTIGLVDEERNVIRTEAAYRMPPDEMGSEMPPGVVLAGRVLLTRQPLILDNYGDVERPTQLDMLQDSVIGLPIFWRDRMIGFFGIGADPPHRFSQYDIETLTVFARHAAIAIENARLFSGMQRALEETQLLYDTSRRISTALNLDEVVAAYLEQVAAKADYACTIVLYDSDDQGERTSRTAHGYWTPETGRVLVREQMPYRRDELDDLLDLGQTVTVADVNQDERVPADLRRLQSDAGRPALALIPLIVHGHRIGLVVLSYHAPQEWRAADLRPYQLTAAQLATAIDSRRQQRLLYEWGQQMAVFKERQRLARELHDAVTQLVFSITLIAQAIAPAWRRDPAEGERRVQRLLELSQAALAEMRALLVELRPVEPAVTAVAADVTMPGLVRVQKEGLISALQNHIRQLEQENVQITMQTNGYHRQARPQEEALYRIAQEALNNVAKHAQAGRIWIALQTEADTISLTVRDNGIGFQQQDVPAGQQPGFGLNTMRTRAEALGGRLQIVSGPGEGTTVIATLPKQSPQEGEKR